MNVNTQPPKFNSSLQSNKKKSQALPRVTRSLGQTLTSCVQPSSVKHLWQLLVEPRKSTKQSALMLQRI